jgi:cell wall-associated NlpC family hydrolase
MQARALLGIALGLTVSLAAACASSGPRPQPFPAPPAAPAPTVEAAPLPPNIETAGYAIASAALRLQGSPYRPGGTDPSGFDCSGLVKYVFGLYGVDVPRVVRDQYRTGRRVSLDELEPGDLIFFATKTDNVSHVGIVIGGDRFVHAPNARGVVRVDSLVSGYWGERVVGARRMN